ncbi:MAG: hypothetical protein K0Q67_1620 [Cellvibrio sp.]|nr:hypothetical protein [Cellvibrio sp.]
MLSALTQLKIARNYDALLPHQPQGASIPKRIYQTYHCLSSIPPEVANNIRTLKKSNPDWEHVLFDDQGMRQFIQQEFPNILRYYDRITPNYGAARADFFRYLLIYRSGGVYLDIKSTITKPLTTTIKPSDKILLSSWQEWNAITYDGFNGWGNHRELSRVSGGELQQWHVAASAGHPYLRAVILQVLKNIDNYNPQWHGVGKKGVLRLTGPIAYTLAIHSAIKKKPCKLSKIKTDYGFEYSIYGSHAKHVTIFSKHYSKSTEAIITETFFGQIISFALKILKRIRSQIKKISLSFLQITTGSFKAQGRK